MNRRLPRHRAEGGAPSRCVAVDQDHGRVFEDGALRSGGRSTPVPGMGRTARWTFARFLPGDHLLLAFETERPWGESGPCGCAFGGVQVVDLDSGQVVALELDDRDPDAEFVPDDAVWHPNGTLALLSDGLLYVQRTRRTDRVDLDHPVSDSAYLLASAQFAGPWHGLGIDRLGAVLTATGPGRADSFTLDTLLGG